MKALSLWQPWATLVAIGVKQTETRPGSFAFKHRGELAVHAAKHWTRDLRDMCLMLESFRRALTPLALKHWPDIPGDRALEGRKALEQYLRFAGGPKGLPLGCVVARTHLNGVCATEKILKTLPDSEMPFGDYTPGRKAIDLGPTVALAEPIRYAGRQGLFTIDEETAARIRAAAPWPWEVTG